MFVCRGTTYGEYIFTGVTSLFYKIQRALSFPRSDLCQASRSAALIQLLPRKTAEVGQVKGLVFTTLAHAVCCPCTIILTTTKQSIVI